MAESLYLKGKLSIMPAADPAALTSLQATENGDYTPPAGYDGFNEVNVNVPAIPAQLTNLSVTSNGDYTPPAGYDGFDEVNVNVPQSAARLTGLTATANGDYTPPAGYDGFDEVNVNVSRPVVDRLETSINHNGTFNVTENKPYGVDYYDPVIVTVDVPEPVLIPKLITQNGVYLASDENADGFANVTVNVPSGATITFNEQNAKICDASDGLTGWQAITTPLVSGKSYVVAIKDATWHSSNIYYGLLTKESGIDSLEMLISDYTITLQFQNEWVQLSSKSLSVNMDMFINIAVVINDYADGLGGASNE